MDKLNENPTWVLQDLFKYTEYRLYVTAVTGAGEGSTSSNSVVQTLEDGKDTGARLPSLWIFFLLMLPKLNIRIHYRIMTSTCDHC